MSSQSEEWRERRGRSGEGAASVVIFVILVAAALYMGWSHRNDQVINPENGLGYALGIIGGSLMLIMLLYPLRKRIRWMRSWGSVAGWFRLHMILGIVGPVLVILHSNFEIKSLNASVALYSMLLVSGSGIIGRYIYSRIHRGLYGGKLEARELLEEAQAFREGLGSDLSGAAWQAQFKALEREAMPQARGFFAALTHAARVGDHSHRSERALLRDFEADIRARAGASPWSGRQSRDTLSEGRARIRRYHTVLRRTASLAVYERLFAAWHVLHLPLFYMLILTALIHVVAVHLY
ncbi:MAG: hypothetical protein ABL883_03730 [Terricaulis sp.]